ncbi:MFS transporter [Streptomyces sp. XM4193]|uniref:MFS transporter n=1 Tax=Streptomyces sp. XM4193 TaxID=2929782 RepID=UPI001FF8E184|nr:MFS transporter [Streptomyces sp. XM4193]MCK1794595.1 MFS transporter [Streptomyces sp. XM4193]
MSAEHRTGVAPGPTPVTTLEAGAGGPSAPVETASPAAPGSNSPEAIGARMDRLPITPTHRKLTLVIGIGLFFDSFDNHLSGTIAQVMQTEFAMDSTALKLALASAFLGQFFGSLLLGRVGDKLGRRRAFMINLGLYSFFTLAGAFSPNAAWLIVTRFIAGMGIGAEQALSDCYLSETLPARKRGRFIAWAYTLCFCGVPAVGFAALWLVPLAPLGIDGWRWLFVLGALGAFVVWVLRRGMIESPRWLASVGRREEADRLVTTMESEAVAGGNRLPEPEPAQAPAVKPNTRLRDLFGRRYRRRTTMLWVLCGLSVVGYYGFGTLAPLVLAAKGYGILEGISFAALSFVGYPVGSLLSVPIMDRIERKLLVALSAVAMAACGLGFAFADTGAWIVAFGFSFTLLSNVFSTVSHVYLAEQYPTSIRATAAGTAYSLSKLSAAAIPFALLPVLDSAGPVWLFGTVALVMVVVAATVLVLGERTTGVSADWS